MERERLVVVFILVSLSRGFFNALFVFSFPFLSFCYPPRKSCVLSSPPPPRDALATPMRLIRSIGPASLFKIYLLFLNSFPLHGHAGSSHYRIRSDLGAPVALSRLSRNWRWWALVPFAAAAVRAGQEPTDGCRSGKSDHRLG